MLGNLAKVGVAGRQFRPGVADADDRLALEFMVRNTLILHPAAVHETVFIGSTKPGGGAQRFLGGWGHALLSRQEKIEIDAS
jgi:hypothetical protein